MSRARKDRPKATESSRGQIITFYSYKGGTGRSMAVANVAWILASNGKKVLVIDWDFEAPGLHRYFHPFLDDPDLAGTPGLIDYFVEISTAARRASAKQDDRWWEQYTSLLRFTESLDWEFPDEGTIDFVPAGRQDMSYPVRVTSFDWGSFYADLNGGLFLQALKEELRNQYDYILIDSRTGISDTSGICTVQMPDALVVCFTLNQQSIRGASAAAASAHQQRLRGKDGPGLTIWPVPMRVESGEKLRLGAARQSYRSEYRQLIAHLPRSERDEYWSEVEVFYQPFFAYEEVLAIFAERRFEKGSLLSSMEALTRRLTQGRIESVPPMNESLRASTLKRFGLMPKTTSEPSNTVFISSSPSHRSVANKIQRVLEANSIPFWSETNLTPGMAIVPAIERAINESAVVVAVTGSQPSSEWQLRELEVASAQDKLILPVFVGGRPKTGLLSNLVGIQLKGDILSKSDANRLINALPTESVPIDPDDPQKGRWGGHSARNDRELTAVVKGLSKDWFGITLTVKATATRQPLAGSVEFHLHPTFTPSVRTAAVKENVATLYLEAYGAFTVGAKADNGATHLELDLSEIPAAPRLFKLR